MKIEIKRITDFAPGLIQYMIKKSYAAFFDYFPGEKERLYAHWESEDRAAFENKYIGNCVAFSCLNDLPIGYFSWAPGNCLLVLLDKTVSSPNFVEKVTEGNRSNGLSTISEMKILLKCRLPPATTSFLSRH
jgi:hypothetical protein